MQRIKKETLAQVFSCEFCEISKNTFFTEHLLWLLLWLHAPKDQTQCYIRLRAKPLIEEFALFAQQSFDKHFFTGATSRGEGGGLPRPFLKIDKMCPKFGKKWPDCVHL